MGSQRILKEGLVGGLIGAAAVALWFLIVDLVAGRPFFTPAMLGSAVFWGARDPAQVQVTFAAVIGYTMIHLLAFCVVGTIAAGLASLAEGFPSTLFLAVVFFAIFEFGFYVLVAVVAQSLLGALAWWAVALGNLIAAARLKAGLTQAQLEKELGIRQNMVSDYERGRRTYSDAMAKRLSKTLKVKEERLKYGFEQDKSRVHAKERC